MSYPTHPLPHGTIVRITTVYGDCLELPVETVNWSIVTQWNIVPGWSHEGTGRDIVAYRRT